MQKTDRLTSDQKLHWDSTFSASSAFFGAEPSGFARKASLLFHEQGVRTLLELGCGQGRDTFLFAGQGLQVSAIDYSETAVSEVNERAAQEGLERLVHAAAHDLRQALPFADQSFDACYSHMLLCMELSTADVAGILRETWRTLRPGGIALYSVRSNFDKHYQAGTHLGDDLYQVGEFVIRFFTETKIRQLAKGFDILEICRIEEGSLPRDLFCVTLRKGEAPRDWEPEPIEEITMLKPLDQFQAFMDSALGLGVLDHKTKQLVALGAALAAGCDP